MGRRHRALRVLPSAPQRHDVEEHLRILHRHRLEQVVAPTLMSPDMDQLEDADHAEDADELLMLIAVIISICI